MNAWHDLLEYVEELVVDVASRRWRHGWYPAKVSVHDETYRRLQVVPNWMPDSAIDHVRRVASPILDVIPAIGTRLAVLSQDGVPEFGAVIGQIWDDLAAPATAWIRANLQDSPGRIEVGAEKSVHIRVVSNSNDGQAPFSMDETIPVGNVVIEVASGSYIDLGSDLTATAGTGQSHHVARADLVEARLQAIESYINTHEHNYVTPLIPAATIATVGKTPVGAPTGIGGMSTQTADHSTECQKVRGE